MKVNGLRVVYQNDEGSVSGTNNSESVNTTDSDFEAIQDLFEITENQNSNQESKTSSEETSSEETQTNENPTDPEEESTEESDTSEVSLEENNQTNDPQSESTEVNTEPEDVNADESSIIAELQSQVAQLTSQITKLTQPVDQSSENEETPQVLPEIDLSSLEGDFESALESKENFLKFMSKAMTIAQNQTIEKVYESIPNVVGNFVQRQSVMQDVAAKFYSDHPELKRVKRYVGTVATEISAEHPDWGVDKVLPETAIRVKKALGIEEAVNTAARNESVIPRKPKSNVALPGGNKGTSRNKVVNFSKLQTEIDDILN